MFARNEIGSEFCSVPLCTCGGVPLPQKAAYFKSGRGALDFVIRDVQARQTFRSVALPSYCCHTMIQPFLDNGIQVSFYPVVLDGKGRLQQQLPRKLDCDGILLLDYFGYRSQSNQPEYDGIVIRDLTHSLFTEEPAPADYYFGSLRKWAGFITGGYAWKGSGTFTMPLPQDTDDTYTALRCRAMQEKEEYLAGNRADKNYLNIFAQAESLLEQNGRGMAESSDLARVRQLDVAFLQRRRRKNAAKLLEYVSPWALYPQLEKGDCPLFVPISLPEGRRDLVRKYLIQNEIYCPVHWLVSPLHQLNDDTQKLFATELSLVCDQRYTPEDMQREGQVILKCLEGI